MRANDLPVWGIRDELIGLLRHEPVVVLEGATGCGKSTQIPRMLYDAGVAMQGRIGVTQPRRIACVSVAHKIAIDGAAAQAHLAEVARDAGEAAPPEQPWAEVGDLVGYKMRFNDHTGPETRIKVMTDGILIQEMQLDPDMNQYDVLMIDEAHERSLNIDIILGLLKRLLVRRPDLRVLISSATIDPRRFSEYFDDAPILTVPHRPHPVDIAYRNAGDAASIDELIELAVDECYRIVMSPSRTGDILVFLTGEFDIKRFVQELEPRVLGHAEMFPLYARMPREEQERVFDTCSRRKVIVSTNIAETSVTIDGVDWVIDSGRVKMNAYDPTTGISSLEERRVSRASAEQRMGRTGRTAPGNCIRLYSRKDMERRSEFTPEEIRRSDLADVVLRMIDLGIKAVESFDFMTPPPPGNLSRTLGRLELLGAITEDRRLTKIGRRMVSFPLDPRQSRIVIESMDRYPTVMREVLINAAFLSTRQPFVRPLGEEEEAREAHARFADPMGDFISYVRMYDAFQASRDRERYCARNYLDLRMLTEIEDIIGQLSDIVRELGGEVKGGGPQEHVIRAITAGLAENLCRRSKRGRGFETLTEHDVFIHPGSFLRGHKPAFFVCGELVRTTRLFARSCTPIQADWIADISPLHKERWLADRKEKKARGGPMEVLLADGPLLLVPEGKGRTLRLDLAMAWRLAREVERGEIIKLGRVRCDIIDRSADQGSLILFKGEPLLDIVDFLRALGSELRVERAPVLGEALDPMEHEAVFDRFAEEVPSIGTQKGKVAKQEAGGDPRGRRGKQGRRGRRADAHVRAGFVTLTVGANDVFWFELVGNPAEAVTRSLEALRALSRVRRELYDAGSSASLRAGERRLAELMDRLIEGRSTAPDGRDAHGRQSRRGRRGGQGGHGGGHGGGRGGRGGRGRQGSDGSSGGGQGTGGQP